MRECGGINASFVDDLEDFLTLFSLSFLFHGPSLLV